MIKDEDYQDVESREFPEYEEYCGIGLARGIVYGLALEGIVIALVYLVSRFF